MYHLELRQFPHSARAFNLGAPELAGLLAPWVAGRPVRWGEREWEPRKAKLTIVEGPELATSELGMGRGWPEAQRIGRDVTEALLAAARESHSGGGDFREEVVALCVAGPTTLSGLVLLAGRRWPERPLSERVATVERAAWELLHAGQLELTEPSSRAPVPAERWREVLMQWPAWGTDGAALRRPAS